MSKPVLGPIVDRQELMCIACVVNQAEGETFREFILNHSACRRPEVSE